MKPKDFKILMAILSTADGGCMSCFGDMVTECYREFPDWPWELLPKVSGTGFDSEQLSALLAQVREDND